MWLKIGGVLAACLIGLGACYVGLTASGDSSTAVPAPEATGRGDTVALLNRATATQGVCYGWQLRGYWKVVSEGSSLGDGVSVTATDRQDECPRWAVIVADVHYTSSSSETEDSVYLRVETSPDLHGVDYTGGLARLGLDDAAYLDDPGWAVTRAATFLPLLTAEAGEAPASTASVAPTARPSAPATPSAGTSSPLPDAGSDFWRDRWGYLLASIGILLVGVVLLAIGWFERRHELGKRAGQPAVRIATGTTVRPAGTDGPDK